MDQGTVVGYQIEEGRRLLAALARERVPVSGAAWLRKDEDLAPWVLYIATPLVTKRKGSDQAHRRVNEVMRGMADPPGLRDLDFRLVDPSDDLGKAVTELQRHYPRRPPVWYGGVRYNLSTEGAYVYPPIATEASNPS